MKAVNLGTVATWVTTAALALACGQGTTTDNPAGPPGSGADGSSGDRPDTSTPGSDGSPPPNDGSPGSPDASPGRDGSTSTDSAIAPDSPASSHAIKTVFIIMMENQNWSAVTTDTSATYINGTLVPNYATATQYYTPPGNHPSEPNYIWLEAGSNLNITTDDDPATNHQSTTSHLVTQLTTAGVSWKAYVENITAGTCPLTSSGLFACKHTPMLFFDDVTNTNSPSAPICISNIVPYGNLASDLSGNTVARYNFITPNLCDDMHNDFLNGGGCANDIDPIVNGDTWLAANLPPILASQAYLDGGLVLVLWDEGALSLSDGPIGAIVLSPLLKSKGYTNSIHYTHSSTLKTVEEIFDVPLLRDAATATTNDLSDFFTAFP